MENGAVILDTNTAEEQVQIVPFSELHNIQLTHFLQYAFFFLLLLSHCAIQKLCMLFPLLFLGLNKGSILLSCWDCMFGFPNTCALICYKHSGKHLESNSS